MHNFVTNNTATLSGFLVFFLLFFCQEYSPIGLVGTKKNKTYQRRIDPIEHTAKSLQNGLKASGKLSPTVHANSQRKGQGHYTSSCNRTYSRVDWPNLITNSEEHEHLSREIRDRHTVGQLQLVIPWSRYRFIIYDCSIRWLQINYERPMHCNQFMFVR